MTSLSNSRSLMLTDLSCFPKLLAGGRKRHAFIGIGFRERSQAYDFQAALHDHIKYPFSINIHQ